MNLVLLDPAELEGTRARVHGRRAEHIATIHRAQPGTVLRIGVVGGRIGRAVVASVSSHEVMFDDITLDADPPAPLACTLVLAIPRPNVLRRVLAGASAIGIKRIALIGSARIEKSYWQSPAAGDDEISRQLSLGLEQGGDTQMPVVEKHRLFRPFVEDELPRLIGSSLAIVAHPDADGPCPKANGTPVTLIVGPEGGLVDHEIALLHAAGCRAVTLGSRALRVEQAVFVLLGRLF